MYKMDLRTAEKGTTPMLRTDLEEGNKAPNFGFIKKELNRYFKKNNLRPKNLLK